MKLEETKYSIAEIVEWYKLRTLIVNSDYQRGGGLWPNSAKSYFIDTILRGFPFPKVYFQEKIDKPTKSPRREIVDGQQRITTIVEFVDDKLVLGKNATNYAGLKFSELSEDLQYSIWAYTVAVDVIRNADKAEILQMFRRMNAFTLPLNEAEKRHSEFFGEFKDWVNQILDKYGAIFSEWGIFTSRQIVRMADAELVADLALACEEGVVSTSPAKLKNLYKSHDVIFFSVNDADVNISEALNEVLEKFSGLRGTYAMRPHVFHSLVCAMIHNKHGLPGLAELIGIDPNGAFMGDSKKAIDSIVALAAAYEEKDIHSKYSEFVVAASEGGNRAPQRMIRIKWLCNALRGKYAA